MAENDMARFLTGECLYGDDMTYEEVQRWFAEEENGYANLGAEDRLNYAYEYHALNQIHGFRFLRPGPLNRVMGFGSAYGDELLPIISRIGSLTIVDPSGAFKTESVADVPVEYVKPSIDGSLPFEKEEFDAITCFGVLHHIPNVSAVISEFARVLKPGGQLLLREPIVSMGDWRFPRRGLTRNERGIPLEILRKIVRSNEFAISHEFLSGFPVTERIFKFIRPDINNSKIYVLVDNFTCDLFGWNVNYHPKKLWNKFRPTSISMVVRKL